MDFAKNEFCFCLTAICRCIPRATKNFRLDPPKTVMSARSIAGQKWSSQGNPVRLLDLQERQLRDSAPYIDELRAKSGRDGNQWGEVTTYSANDGLKTALKDAWLVMECVPEKLPLKKKIIQQIDDLASPETIIASNSSSYAISEIVQGLGLKDASRTLSAHCYWPPETSAVELMAHDGTDSSIIPILMEQCKKHGFSPFHVRKNSTGYIYNRIWAAIKREALMVASEGVASPEEIDKIFKDVLKTPKGPCEQMDVVGLDVVLDIEEHYAESRPGLSLEPREYLKKIIAEGRLGVKNGRGFYEYGDSQ